MTGAGILAVYDAGAAIAPRFTIYIRKGRPRIASRGACVRDCLRLSVDGEMTRATGTPGPQNGRLISPAELPPACRKVLQESGYL